jgi:hypothetical protein
MKLLSIAFTLVFAASLIHKATGLICSSACAACWKIGSPGIDIKMGCDPDADFECGNECPNGYEGIHCAQFRRCTYVEKSFFSNVRYFFIT